MNLLLIFMQVKLPELLLFFDDMYSRLDIDGIPEESFIEQEPKL